MKRRLLVTVFAALLVALPLTGSHATGSVQPSSITNSGPHDVVGVTEITPSLLERFPTLGSQSRGISRDELMRGGPNVPNDDGVDLVDK
jgi:hypothetical protein